MSSKVELKTPNLIPAKPVYYPFFSGLASGLLVHRLPSFLDDFLDDNGGSRFTAYNWRSRLSGFCRSSRLHDLCLTGFAGGSWRLYPGRFRLGFIGSRQLIWTAADTIAARWTGSRSC